MFSKKMDLNTSKQSFEKRAWEIADDQQRTKGLLFKAIKKANRNRNTLGETWEKLQLFFDLVRSYSKGEYRNISKSTIITIIGAILYFISPIDLIPDFIIGLGIMDDAAVIGFTMKKVSKEIDEYTVWKKSHNYNR